MARKVISGGITGLSVRFMTDLSSNGGVPASPFYGLEPNSYADYGGKVTTVTRNPISRSRQRKKGTVTDFDASGGFNHDWTQHQLDRLVPALFYSNPFEKPTTAPLFGVSVPVTAVAAATGFVVDNDPDMLFKPGHLVLASGFPTPGNNGLKPLTAVSATHLMAAGLTDEAGTPAKAKLEVVGFQFAAGDLTLDAQASQGVLTSAAVNLTTLGLHRGEWIFLGDASNAAYIYAGVLPFYGRISLAEDAITAGSIKLDKTTAALVDDVGAAKTLRMFFGTFTRNMTEDEIVISDDIIRHFMQLERTLGSDGDGMQSQILDDAVANALTYTQPLAGKISCDMTFVALNEFARTGADGLIDSPLGRISGLGEAAFNSSTCLYRARMSLLDPTTLNPTPLFAYVQAIELTLENAVKAVKVQGDVGGIDTIEGDLAAGGSATVFFSKVAAVQAVRNYSDVTFDAILAQRNAGYVWDIPLLGLGNGQLEVTKDDPITVPLDMGAAENFAGYTASYTSFSYLPTVAMPAIVQ